MTPKRKRVIQKSFNKKSHDENLYSPNGRVQQSQTSSWISQHEQSFPQNNLNSMPKNSATSFLNLETFNNQMNFDNVINYLKHASDEQISIVLRMLQSGWGSRAYMDHDQTSED